MTTPSFEAEPDGVLENTGENCTTVQPGLARSTEECVNAPDLSNTVPNNIYSLGDRIKINNPSMLSYSESFEQITWSHWSTVFFWNFRV